MTKDLQFKWLKPECWLTQGHTQGSSIWNIPPATAKVVVEQLGFTHLQRHEAFHIIIIPRLMTGHWCKHLTRGTDGYM
jgi:hypothetical protein